MKIGILTFHKAKNYGAILQAFALMTKLRELGHKPYIINRPNKKFKFSRYILHLIKDIISLDVIRWYSFKNFANSILKPTTRKYNNKNILKFDKFENFDCCIVGSDQVWRLEYSQIGLNFFFDFIKDSKVKKISYAASFGIDTWKEQNSLTKKVKKQIEKFSGVSIREDSGVRICKSKFNVDATLVLDPALLLTKERYIELFQIEKFKKTSSKEILATYIIGKNKKDLKLCSRFSKENNLIHKILFYNTLNPLDSYFKNPFFYYNLKEWVQNIYNADYIITNSYHGTIVSIIFEKPFFVLNNKSAGIARLKTLLGMLNLTDRFIENPESISFTKMNDHINYSSVKDVIDTKIKASINFLDTHLK